MRSPNLFTLLAVVVAVVPVVAQQPAKKDEPKLKIGDPAPPLTVGKWHQGPEVKEFEKGKVYVVVFWEADKVSNPTSILREIAALKSKHKDVVPVAVSSAPEKEEKGRDVTREVEDKRVVHGRTKFPFAFANDPDKVTQKAYGVTDVPAVRVVGKDGKIAFIPPDLGHVGPSCTDHLAEVLPKVLDGSWKGEKDAEALADTEKEYQKAMSFAEKRRALGGGFEKLSPAEQREANAKLATEALKSADGFLKAHPAFATHSRTLFYRAMVTIVGGQKAAAKAVDALIADGLARGTLVEMVTVARVVAEEWFDGGLSPEVEADKLVGKILDAVLNAPAESIDAAENIDYLLKACLYAGFKEKGPAIVEHALAGAPADLKPEQAAEMKKNALRVLEEQAKRLDEERKKRKK